MSKEIPEDLIHAAFFFVDIVGLSNPVISTETQRTKIKILNEAIYSCKTFTLTKQDDLFILPTGDGMLIGFKDGLEQPIKLAIELHSKIQKYNENCLTTEKIGIRIGCNVGHVFVVKDIFGNMNLWGPGAILARRVMDLGDENHILLTSNMANDLIEVFDDYKSIIHPMHNYKIKHNEELLVYSVYGKDFGNKEPPKKTMTRSINPQTPTTICKKITFNVHVKEFSKTMHTKHERIYDFVNDSSSPIYEIYVGILTSTEINSTDLKLRAIDEDGNQLEISKISSISPFSKRITVKLKRPVFRGGEGRRIKFFYEKNEVTKSFEHIFHTNTHSFELNLIMPYNFPEQDLTLTLVDENNQKKKLPQTVKTSKGLSRILTWKIDEHIAINQRLRLEWYDENPIQP